MITSTHTVAHNHVCNSGSKGSDALFSPPWALFAYGTFRHTGETSTHAGKNIHMYKVKKQIRQIYLTENNYKGNLEKNVSFRVEFVCM